MPTTSKPVSAPPNRLRRNALVPYQRCRCGVCRECIDNAKWDERFAKFEVKVYWDERGFFGSPLSRI
jgi:hypothetical protein